MDLYNTICLNNLLPLNIKAYVEPFTNGSQLFWKKNPSFTEFINDVDHSIQEFLLNIRLGNKLDKDSIYFKHQKYTQNINDIIKSNFYKRLQLTYIFDRSYDRLIASTDSNETFYYCPILPSQNILQDFKKIKGMFLFVFDVKKLNEFNIENLNSMIVDNYVFIYNYNNSLNQDDLFSL